MSSKCSVLLIILNSMITSSVLLVQVWVSSLVPCGVNGVQKWAKDTALWYASFESDNERGQVCDCSVGSLFISLLRLVEIWPELKSTNSTLK